MKCVHCINPAVVVDKYHEALCGYHYKERMESTKREEPIMLLDEIISSYCGTDDELYGEIATELSKFMHTRGTNMEMLPGELSEEACACWTLYEEELDKRKQYRTVQMSHYLGSLDSMNW